MNTRFEYLYRNASNYKQWGAVVFSGVANEAIERRLAATLESFEYFIADQGASPSSSSRTASLPTRTSAGTSFPASS